MPDVVIYTPPSNFKWGQEGADIGGSELWADTLAIELGERGFNVTLVCSAKGKFYRNHASTPFLGNVLVCTHEDNEVYSSCNYLICSRTAEPLRRISADKKFVIYHDVITTRNWEFFPDLQGMMFPGTWDDVDKFVFVSSWQRDTTIQLTEALAGFNPFENKAEVIPNGYYPARFAKKREKKNRIIFSSNPERGLQLLLELFPEIRKRTGAELRVCYGLEFYKSHSGAINQSWMEYIERSLDQDGVTYLGHLNQDDLAEEYLDAKVWAYPSNFPETFCITALEAMAGGCNVVATAQAALTNTLDRADLLKAPAGSTEFNEMFIDLVADALKAPEKDYTDHLDQFTWKQVVDQWVDLLENEN